MRRLYGAPPLHLLGHLAALALAVYALLQAIDLDRTIAARSFALWFLGGALLHDLVLVPAYTLLDRGARRVLGVSAINHVRAPVVLAAALLLVHWPLILNDAPGTYRRATGRDPSGYLERWLWICAALFAASALLYAWRVWRARGEEP